MDRADDASRSAPLTPVNPAFVFSQAQVANLASLVLLEATEKLVEREGKQGENIPSDPAQVEKGERRERQRKKEKENEEEKEEKRKRRRKIGIEIEIEETGRKRERERENNP
jgi:hypothetical protein